MKPKNLYAAAAVLALAVGVGLLTPSGTAHAQPPPVPHYECYDVFGPPPPGLPPYLTLETQFGVDEVAVGPMPMRLCLPALKQVPTGGWEGDLSAPHVECLPIAGESPLKIVNLETQFGIQKNVVVGDPISMCMPATKTIFPVPATEPPALVPHYECYEISGEPPVFPPVLIETQFGTHEVAVGEPTRLCLPAIKNQEPGSLEVPHVECFQIDPGPPVPPKVVNLLTQFGPQEFVEVGPALELCVPALKTVVVGVGGAQGLPDVAGNADSGGSSLPYAALAGAAAGLVVLVAGGWYARRRWLS